MSAALGRSVMREPAGAHVLEAVSEPAWPWPIDLTRYDRTPTLSASEVDALQTTRCGSGAGHARGEQPGARSTGWSAPR